MASQAVTRRTTVKDIVALPNYKSRFNEVLGEEKSRRFLGSLVALTAEKNLAECDPHSVVASAFIAATLDLPVNKNLGLAWIVPYRGVAQFQMGWRGFVQLAMRSGQYARLNAFKVNAEAYGGLDNVGEAKIKMTKLDDTKPPVGYAVVFQLVNGFRKVVYWSKEKVEKHAERYSQAYKSRGKFETPWQTHFDEMALKTVVANGLKAWGPMSTEMVDAAKYDQALVPEIGAEPVYLDGTATKEIEQGEEEEPPKGSASENLAEKILRERQEKAAAAAAPVA